MGAFKGGGGSQAAPGTPLQIMVFFFLLLIDFLNILVGLAFLIPTLSLFQSFIQYGKNVILKDIGLAGTGLIIEGDDHLIR